MASNFLTDIFYNSHFIDSSDFDEINYDIIPELEEEDENFTLPPPVRLENIMPAHKIIEITPEQPFECPITHEMHAEGFKLSCGHIFSDKILDWRARTCPLCRHEY